METGKTKPKRQIYIPDNIIRKLKLKKGDRVAVCEKDGWIKLVKAKNFNKSPVDSKT
jgi:bifunctional DNA-binding transcriptional regulator/antitoxin component of YhaV-PrlF toxin-antitoxin module